MSVTTTNTVLPGVGSAVAFGGGGYLVHKAFQHAGTASEYRTAKERLIGSVLEPQTAATRSTEDAASSWRHEAALILTADGRQAHLPDPAALATSIKATIDSKDLRTQNRLGDGQALLRSAEMATDGSLAGGNQALLDRVNYYRLLEGNEHMATVRGGVVAGAALLVGAGLATVAISNFANTQLDKGFQ
jgi:hypothetical protein